MKVDIPLPSVLGQSYSYCFVISPPLVDNSPSCKPTIERIIDIRHYPSLLEVVDILGYNYSSYKPYNPYKNHYSYKNL